MNKKKLSLNVEKGVLTTMKNIADYNQDFASVWAAMDRTDQLIAESNARMEKLNAESKARMDELNAESKARMDELNAESKARMDELNAETNKKIAATTANIDKYYAEFRETRKEVNGMGKSYGMHAESYFFESLRKTKIFGGITYNFVVDDYKGTHTLPNGELLVGQFDIVMHNGDSVAIIEVKSKVQKEDVYDLITRKVAHFKLMFPQYADKKFYLGVAGFSYDKYAEEKALNSGVGILKLTGENVEIQDRHLIVY